MKLKVNAVLDPQFQPLSLLCREMREATKENGQDLVIGIQRNKGYITTYKTRIYPDGIGKDEDQQPTGGFRATVVGTDLPGDGEHFPAGQIDCVQYGFLRHHRQRIDGTGQPGHLQKKLKKTLKIAIAGKYTKLSDAYISVVESLKHAGYQNNASIDIKWINSEECTDSKQCAELLKDVQGVIVPGGFGIKNIG